MMSTADMATVLAYLDAMQEKLLLSLNSIGNKAAETHTQVAGLKLDIGRSETDLTFPATDLEANAEGGKCIVDGGECVKEVSSVTGADQPQPAARGDTVGQDVLPMQHHGIEDAIWDASRQSLNDNNASRDSHHSERWPESFSAADLEEDADGEKCVVGCGKREEDVTPEKSADQQPADNRRDTVGRENPPMQHQDAKKIVVGRGKCTEDVTSVKGADQLPVVSRSDTVSEDILTGHPVQHHGIEDAIRDVTQQSLVNNEITSRGSHLCDQGSESPLVSHSGGGAQGMTEASNTGPVFESRQPPGDGEAIVGSEQQRKPGKKTDVKSYDLEDVSWMNLKQAENLCGGTWYAKRPKLDEGAAGCPAWGRRTSKAPLPTTRSDFRIMGAKQRRRMQQSMAGRLAGPDPPEHRACSTTVPIVLGTSTSKKGAVLRAVGRRRGKIGMFPESGPRSHGQTGSRGRRACHSRAAGGGASCLVASRTPFSKPGLPEANRMFHNTGRCYKRLRPRVELSSQ